MEIKISKIGFILICIGTIGLFAWLIYPVYRSIDLSSNHAYTKGIITGFDQDANGNLTVDYEYSVNGKKYNFNNYRDNHYIPKVGDTVRVKYSTKDAGFSEVIFENSEVNSNLW